MQRIDVSFERTDSIQFLLDSDPSLNWISTIDSAAGQRFFVYIDANVQRLWGDRILEQLSRAGRETHWFTVEPTEASKSLGFYPTALSFLETHGAGRYDLVIAIGGGIVIDLVSFLVSTYMRGLPFYAIPTTLIGQMDASTAGKTCLNTSSAKNVLGTFYYPLVVYNNISFLDTNTEYYLRQGYSETFKYGLLGCPELLSLLETHRAKPSSSTKLEMVTRAIETRVMIRKRDPLASNLGHTFGHALETLSNYEILHGDAISAGTVMALHYAQRKGLISESAVEDIVGRMRRLSLNVHFDSSVRAGEMVRKMMRDKKASADKLHLVLIRNIGEPYLTNGSSFYPASPGDVEEFLVDYLANSGYGIADCAAWLRRDELYRG
jgi:3-dehydroquinate synthetase